MGEAVGLDELSGLRARVRELEAALADRATGAKVGRMSVSVAAAVDAAPLVLWAFDQNGRVQLSAGRGVEQLGFQPGELVGANVFDLYREHPEALVPIERALQGREGHFRAEVQGAVWEHRYFPRNDETGNPDGLIGISMTIPSCARADAERRNAEDRFRSLVESLPDTILSVDLEGKLTFINRREGLANEELLAGDEVFKFLNEQSIPRAKEALQVAFEKGQRSEYEAESRDEGQNRRFLCCRVSPIFKREKVVGATIVVTDVSEARHSEERRAQLEAQVQHSQRLESLGVLAGGIAHDFNNLLVAVFGYADLARRDMKNEKALNRDLDGILEASERASDLCAQMLAYAGRGTRERKVVDLTELVGSMGQLMEVSVGKGVVIERELSEDLPGVEVDSSQIHQVVLNLLTNAAESMEGRSGKVYLRTGVVPCDAETLARSVLPHAFEPGEHVFVEVEDRGCGMSPTTREKMFDPFYTTKATGRGLGMAAVLGIIDAHSGALLVSSEEGRGTAVRVLFPAASCRPLAAAPSGTTPISDFWGKDRLILVADDEAGVRHLARVALEAWGFRMLSAVNGREAVELYRAHGAEIAAVLLDVTMPVMDGIEALSLLRLQNPRIRVILSSGYQGRAREDSIHSKYPTLQKPYRLRDLRWILHQTLAEEVAQASEAG